MSIEIGSAYTRTKTRLHRGIREGSIKTPIAVPDDHSCYFCGAMLSGSMRVLRETGEVNGFESETDYYIGEVCFRRSFYYEYINGLESSMN